MTFYSPLAFTFFITVPIIIILYLLKQRHQEHTVSSLYLWQEVLRDIEANAPWQKLRKNILMILQIAAMVLLVLALSRPFLNAVGDKGGSAVVMIDTSLSMQAADFKPSRFEAAKRQAAAYVTGLKPGTLVTLINMGSSAVIEGNLSSDRNSLIESINRLKVSNGTANSEDASSLVQSIVKQYPGTEVVLFGDEELEIPGVDVKFSNFSRNGDNYAITLLSHSVTRSGITALSRVANFSTRDVEIPVSLYADGRVFDAKNVKIKPGETENVYWNAIPPNTLAIECRIDEKDCLDADNNAWNAVNPVKTGRVMLVAEKNVFIEKVISLMSGAELFKTGLEGADGLKGYDLYIFDGIMPDRLPSDGNLIIFNPPENKLFTVKGGIELPNVEKSRHELFKYVNDYSFTIGRTKIMTVPKWGEPVLESREGPVIFAGNLENKRALVFGFDLHNSDIPLKSTFPILMTSALEWPIPSGIKNVENVFPGQGLEFNLNPKAEQVRVKTPGGTLVTVAPPFPAGVFYRTEETGRYVLEQKTSEGTSNHYFTVNVPAEKESNLISGVKASASAQGTSAKTGNPVNRGLNLQWILLWLIIALLIIEWWVYTYGVSF